jgi:hypothetical protein
VSLNFSTAPATYRWPISFYIAGVEKPATLIAVYRRLAGTRVKEIIADAKSSIRGEDGEEPQDEIELVMEIMEDWVADDGKDPIPFSEATLRNLADQCPKLPGELIGGFISSVYKGKAKNSKAQ